MVMMISTMPSHVCWILISADVVCVAIAGVGDAPLGKTIIHLLYMLGKGLGARAVLHFPREILWRWRLLALLGQ